MFFCFFVKWPLVHIRLFLSTRPNIGGFLFPVEALFPVLQRVGDLVRWLRCVLCNVVCFLLFFFDLDLCCCLICLLV